MRRYAAFLLMLRRIHALSPTAKTVVLVRHGAVNREAAGLTPNGLYGGDVDVPLSDRGEAEAIAAAERGAARHRGVVGPIRA